ncbi:MAG: 23S rRNA (uracil(1939)-C(5))-methyltransferase RlmD [Oscillospiraceae bacterium]|nr:23S rRNA (uracil(1939)-C(5))-methyltransferase RlmD [Oscillospiraceae bacterium]
MTGVVEAYNSDGAGIVKPDGAVVFVPGAVRGETVEYRVTRTRANVAEAELCRVLTPSPFRRTPDCSCFGHCGGCDFRHVAYQEELHAKRQRVQDALTRLGGAEIEVEPVSGAEHPCRYRNKSQYPVSADGVIGFYRAGSHEVVDVRDCLLQPPATNRTADAVRAWMSRYHVTGYDERAGKGLIRHLYVRVNRRGESLCCIVANGKTLPKEPELVGIVLQQVPETVGVVLNTNTRRGNVILGERYRVLWGRDFLCDTLRVPVSDGTRELCFKLSLPSFYQVNPEQTEKLYALAVENAALSGAETVLDLYCGIGTITLSMALSARRVLGAEIVAHAVRDAAENASRNGITNAEFICADAAELARRVSADGLRPDVVTVDPPRKGLTPDGIASIASMQPSRVVYVSCDPGTLGRDIQRFAAYGYRVRRASPVDMFPGTRHVETVVLLSRQKPDTE